ncbi:hypothetical protein BLNAU_21509 [Blattamonas nauphoetae]|uniref:Auto-transporter adhesin head GIN domain-containing protein n=1 Tax=Blattamonas nauphoetae TaxID=2049346 RepID=A0ABQ9WW78_9EUKA|nr:hypothetical protein BLNAU_21509 [Blattamonas nauphoetae]
MGVAEHCGWISKRKSGHIRGTQVEVTDNDVYVATTGTNPSRHFRNNKVTETMTLILSENSAPHTLRINLPVPHFSPLSPILDGEAILTNSFVKVTGGHFVLANVLMEGSLFVADFSSSSVVSSKLQPDSSLTLDSVTCVSCKSTGQSAFGEAVSVSIVDGTLEVKPGTSFEKCSSSGNGGALFIDMTERTTGTFTLKSIVYGSGEDANSCTGSGKGTDLFIAAKEGDLAVINSTSVIGEYLSTPASEATTFSSSDLSKFEFSETPLQTNKTRVSIVHLHFISPSFEIMMNLCLIVSKLVTSHLSIPTTPPSPTLNGYQHLR